MERKYRFSDIESVIGGIEACLTQAAELQRSAQLLTEHGSHALSLSIAVLSLEEIGKMLISDGLIFSKANDEKSNTFDKSMRDHKQKLRVLRFFPQSVEYFSVFDTKSKAYAEHHTMALKIALSEYAREMEALEPWLGKNCELTDLDKWKQAGFYTHLDSAGNFRLPSNAVSSEFARAVVAVSRRFVTTFEFLLLENFGNYRAIATSARGNLTEADHSEFEARAERLVAELFN